MTKSWYREEKSLTHQAKKKVATIVQNFDDESMGKWEIKSYPPTKATQNTNLGEMFQKL